jgi:hypothetical protein
MGFSRQVKILGTGFKLPSSLALEFVFLWFTGGPGKFTNYRNYGYIWYIVIIVTLDDVSIYIYNYIVSNYGNYF